MCNVISKDLPGKTAYTLSKDPTAFTDSQHPYRMVLSSKRRVINMIRAVVEMNNNPDPLYMDVIELRVNGSNIAVSYDFDAVDPSDDKTLNFDFSEDKLISGTFNNLNYSLFKDKGKFVLLAACNDQFIDTFNSHQRDKLNQTNIETMP